MILDIFKYIIVKKKLTAYTGLTVIKYVSTVNPGSLLKNNHSD